MRLTGAIPKQSNSTVPPWLNLRRKPELNLLPLELDFLYGVYFYCGQESLFLGEVDPRGGIFGERGAPSQKMGGNAFDI